MSSPRFCICPAPLIEVAEGVRLCRTCGERENPVTFAMAQALAGPLAELRHRIAALDDALVRGGRPEVPGLVDAAEMAQMLGKRRDWVYRHARELGGVPMGSGPRPRWGFNVGLALAKLAARDDDGGPTTTPPATSARTLPASAPLLPVRGEGKAA